MRMLRFQKGFVGLLYLRHLQWTNTYIFMLWLLLISVFKKNNSNFTVKSKYKLNQRMITSYAKMKSTENIVLESYAPMRLRQFEQEY